MKFALRFLWDGYKQLLKLMPKDVIKFTLVTTLCVFLIIAMRGFKEGWVIWLLCWALGAAAFCFLLFAVLNVITSYKFIKVFGILNKKGFCPEYLKAFEENFIFGKPINNSLYISYATIHMELKNYKTALDILNALKVPEDDVPQRAYYIFAYMMLAVKMDDSALADDVWRCNQNFINANINNPKLDMHGNQLYLAMVYADCAAERYERALKTCDDILSAYSSDKSDSKFDFMVVKIYTLKKLGRDEEVNTALQEFYSAIKSWKPSMEYMHDELVRSAESAAKGDISE